MQSIIHKNGMLNYIYENDTVRKLKQITAPTCRN